jgi:hypothetical protein
MAIELLFNRKNPGKIGILELDAMLSERQKYGNDITNFPIESGSSISDHVIQAPEEVEIEGFVTNTPVEFLSGLRPEKDDRVLNAYLTLLEIAGYKYPNQAYRYNKLTVISEAKNEFKLVEIISGLRVYTNMGLVTLDIPLDAKTGDCIKFNALFRKVNIVEVVEIPRIPETISEPPERSKKQIPDKVDTGKSGTGELESIAHIEKVKIIGGN